MPHNRKAERDKLAAQVAAFKEQGGKITELTAQVRSPTPIDMRTFRAKDVALQKWEGKQ